MSRVGREIRYGSALLALAGGVWLLAILARSGGGAPAPTAAEYVGNAACLGCHTQQAGFQGTAHHRASALASAATILGSFRPGENVLRTPNPYVHFRMEATPQGFFQTGVVGTPPDEQTQSERIDLVLGSGRKGQSYLSWGEDNRLEQLPVSYWTALEAWVHSPGYPEEGLNFGRPATPRCLECHSSYFQALPAAGAGNRYDRSNFILGVSCEKCHGPGKEHVERQASPLRALLGSGIVNPAELGRQGQIEVCALCHAGVGEPKRPPFSYRPGQPLGEYLDVSPGSSAPEIDVHGNQVALLARSACFQQSDMTCSTCHEVHRTERDPAALAKQCLSCHQVQSCGTFPEHGTAIRDRCVDCHMPALPSNTIVSSHGGRSVQPLVRSHWIRVYPELRAIP